MLRSQDPGATIDTKPMPHPLYFIRHGETDWNAEGRLQGQRDIPLNDVGRVQAAEAGAILKSLGPDLGDLAYWASPLSRAVETMTILRASLDMAPDAFHRDARLSELSFGRWEGLTWAEVERRDPATARARIDDKWNVAPPEGESYAMLARRLAGFLGLADRPGVIVAHGGVGRALLHMIGGRDETRAAETFIRQGVVYVFEGGATTLHDRIAAEA